MARYRFNLTKTTKKKLKEESSLLKNETSKVGPRKLNLVEKSGLKRKLTNAEDLLLQTPPPCCLFLDNKKS